MPRFTAAITKGFTLMEMIGVMAVIAIMAAVMAPSLIETIDDAFSEAEATNVANLAEALEQYIRDNKIIPSQNVNAWVNAIASVSDYRANDIQFNRRGFRRRIYIDPRFFTGTDTAFPGYTQTTGLTAQPVSPRIMVLSDLTRNLPAPPNTSTNFNDIWNQNLTATILEGEKVKVQRMHLAGWFHRVILANANTQQVAYNLEAGALASVPAAVGATDGTLTRFILSDSQLSLYANPFPTGALQTRSITTATQSYRFETDGMNWFWARQ